MADLIKEFFSSDVGKSVFMFIAAFLFTLYYAGSRTRGRSKANKNNWLNFLLAVAFMGVSIFVALAGSYSPKAEINFSLENWKGLAIAGVESILMLWAVRHFLKKRL